MVLKEGRCIAKRRWWIMKLELFEIIQGSIEVRFLQNFIVADKVKLKAPEF